MVTEDVALLAQSILPRFAEIALRLSIKLVSSILSEAATGSTIAYSNLETLEEHDKNYLAHLKIILVLIENLHRKVWTRYFMPTFVWGSSMTLYSGVPALSRRASRSAEAIQSGKRVEG